MIIYGNGFVEKRFADSVEELVSWLQGTLSYTGCSVKIMLDDEVLMISDWYGVVPEEQDDVLAQFGSYGFYTPFRYVDSY